MSGPVCCYSRYLSRCVQRFNPPCWPVLRSRWRHVREWDDLNASHYLLPAFTTIIFGYSVAYPPGFLSRRLAADLFGLGSTEVVRWVPAFFASLSIPAFYLLALRLLKDKYRAGVSTLFFALMPRALSWFVMGGGLTRSPGQFFMLLTLATVVRMYEGNRRVDIILAGVLGAWR